MAMMTSSSAILAVAAALILVMQVADAAAYTIFQLDPVGAGSSAGQVNVTITGTELLDGDLTFVLLPTLHGFVQYNCTSPPSLDSLQRSPDGTIVNGTDSSSVLLNLTDLHAGNYTLCYKGTSDTDFTEVADVYFEVGGAMDSQLSTVSCCGPFEAGVAATCTITAVDENGYVTGSSADECSMVLCPLQDGMGNTIENYTTPSYIFPGVFEFTFQPAGSGCMGRVGVKLGGDPIGRKNQFFSVQPAAIEAGNARADCYWDEASSESLCNITKRDMYNNPVERCSMNANNTQECVEITP